MLLNCQQCGNAFSDSPANKRKYCCHACYSASKEKKIPRVCECCGKAFQCIQADIDKAHRKNSDVRYCSRECYEQCRPRGRDHKWWGGGDVVLKCDNCAKEFTRPREQDRRDKYRFTFCKYECRVTYLRTHPEASPHWKDGATQKQYDIRKHWTYLQWRKTVMERDDYRCKKCKQRGGRLNAHHLYDFSKYPELRLNLDNGHTLCKSCHKAIRGHEREYRISIGLPPDNPPFRLELFPAWDK